MSDFGWQLSSDFRATLSDYGWRLSTFRRLSSDFRLSDYDQRLSRSEVSDFGWRLSDYDRPPSFRVEVRRFSDLLTGWRLAGLAAGGWRLAGLAAGGAGGWRLAAGAMFAINLDFLLRLQLTSKCKYAILHLQKTSKRKFDL